MVICKNDANYILWFHMDNAIKELEEYKNREDIIVIENTIIPEMPVDENLYAYLFCPETRTIQLAIVGLKELTNNEVYTKLTEQTRQINTDTLINTDLQLMTQEQVEVVSIDNLTNTDLIMMILDNQSLLLESQSKIITHLNNQ